MRGTKKANQQLIFGVDLPTSAGFGNDPVRIATRAEELGFDFVSSNDHPCGNSPTYETWTMLCWVAARTTRIRVASRVLGVPYRAPAMVAKMSESLDRLSEGRLILGMGGGSSDHEFRAFGLPTPNAKDKVLGLEEAVRVIRGLWNERDFTFEGLHHRTRSANIEPKPDHSIPIWLGTFGKKALEVTGRVADGWIPTLSLAQPESIPSMRDKILNSAQDAGRDPSELTFIYNMEIHVGSRSGLEPHVLQGHTQELVETLIGYSHLGFKGMNFSLVGHQDEQMEALATEVLPLVRQSS